MKFWKAKIVGERFTYDEKEIPCNVWVAEPPYAVKPNVFIQDYSDKVSFSWVDTRIVKEKNGEYKVGGLFGGDGAKPVKCWMAISFPFEDSNGWNGAYINEVEFPKKENKFYLVCIEIKECGRTYYKLKPTLFANGKWSGIDRKDSNREVIAWREFPAKSRKKWC